MRVKRLKGLNKFNKYSGFGISAFCLLLLASACTSKDETESIQTPSPSPTKASVIYTPSEGHVLTEKDMAIGDLSIGLSAEEVERIFGKPSQETITHGIGDPLWIYKEKGIELSLGGEVWAIRVKSPFSATTPRGIGVGSTEEEVKSAYPEAKQLLNTANNGANHALEQKSPDNKYTLQFTIEDSRVTGIAFIKDLVIQ